MAYYWRRKQFKTCRCIRTKPGKDGCDLKIEVDHIGYAVKDINVAIAAYEKLGYLFTKPITDMARHVMASMGVLGNNKIELISPIPEGGGVSG